jgi:hypothetical protein
MFMAIGRGMDGLGNTREVKSAPRSPSPSPTPCRFRHSHLASKVSQGEPG